MPKPYKLGIVVGRFQTFHKGHKEIIDKAVELCDRVGVFIGSSQESGTEKNPFTYEMRERILKKIYGDGISVFPLPDIGVGNNARWGKYLLENVKNRLGACPDLMVSGEEERRTGWFDGLAEAEPDELYIPKTIDISAEKMREMIVRGDFKAWKEYTDERLWDSFNEMRAVVLASKDNTESSSF